MMKSLKNLLRIIAGSALALSPLVLPFQPENVSADSVHTSSDAVVMFVAEPDLQTEIITSAKLIICNQALSLVAHFDKLLYSDCDLHISIKKEAPSAELMVTTASSYTKVVMLNSRDIIANYAIPVAPHDFLLNFSLPIAQLQRKPQLMDWNTVLREKFSPEHLALIADFDKLNILRC